MCKWNVWQAVGEYVFGGGEGWSLSCIFGLKVVLTVRNCHCLNLEESYFFSPGFVEWFRLDGTSQGLSALSNSTQECCFVLTKTRFFCFSHMLIRNHVLFFILKAQPKSYGYFNFFFSLQNPRSFRLGWCWRTVLEWQTDSSRALPRAKRLLFPQEGAQRSLQDHIRAARKRFALSRRPAEGMCRARRPHFSPSSQDSQSQIPGMCPSP